MSSPGLDWVNRRYRIPRRARRPICRGQPTERYRKSHPCFWLRLDCHPHSIGARLRGYCEWRVRRPLTLLKQSQICPSGERVVDETVAQQVLQVLTE